MTRSTVVRLRVACLVGLALLAAPGARAEQAEIIKNLGEADAQRLVRALDPNYVDKGKGAFLLTLSDSKTIFYTKGNNLQLYAGFKMRKKLSADTINDWNRSKRYSRAYIDKAGDPVIEADLDLTGGVTYANVGEYLATWKTTLTVFKTHIGFNR